MKVVLSTQPRPQCLPVPRAESIPLNYFQSGALLIQRSFESRSNKMAHKTLLLGSVIAFAAAIAGAQLQAAPQQPSLYERLGGVFSIAAVVDHFSDAIVQNHVVGQRSQNPQLREWHTKNLDRLPGLKFMRTLWVCNATGGPCEYTPTKAGSTPLGLENAHRELKISPAEFDAVAEELGRSLDHFKVPAREKGEVLAAFAAHKDEVTQGYRVSSR